MTPDNLVTALAEAMDALFQEHYRWMTVGWRESISEEAVALAGKYLAHPAVQAALAARDAERDAEAAITEQAFVNSIRWMARVQELAGDMSEDPAEPEELVESIRKQALAEAHAAIRDLADALRDVQDTESGWYSDHPDDHCTREDWCCAGHVAIALRDHAAAA